MNSGKHEGRIPTEKECLEMLAQNNVPENIVRHSVKVKEFALEFAQKMAAKGVKVNLSLVRAGALLHDLDKFETLGTKKMHGTLAWEKLRAKGCYAVAEIARKHLIERVGELSSWEEKLVYYADKRIIDEKLVSVPERLEFIKQKYGLKDKKLMAKIKESENAILALEKSILETLNN
ncbi:MAG: HDIG domain-containing protein [Candidatus Diapherotrites archaeon]|nr:HDIG domain-containing protein [Candidatus Diapherotrites archaeon]